MARRIGMGSGLGIVIFLIVLIASGLFLAKQFEWYDPVVTTDLDSEAIGLRPFTVTVRDEGRGLSYVAISLIAGGSSQTLFFEELDSPLKERSVKIQLDPSRINLKEGPAILRVTAGDRSYWSFFRGNKTVADKPVTVDLTPPTVEIVSDDRYLTLGGSAVVVYRSSPDTRTSKLRIGKHTFPAYRRNSADPHTSMAFFAHPYDTPVGERATIVAEDHAGNVAEFKLAYNLRKVRYRAVDVKVSDDFITNKVKPLLQGANAKTGSPAELFVAVNRDLRRQNETTISSVCRGSVQEKLWDGPFMQLSNSKVKSNFADQRSYFYEGKVIDRANHLGYDLAVTRQYPVEAGNDGIVVLAGPLGIYGNTVILDHGFGLCSLYSHLSSVNVPLGGRVVKGQTVGRTGETGLATGDHLHYGVYIYGVPVLPLEWWDSKWITDNVLGKLTVKAPETRSNVMR